MKDKGKIKTTGNGRGGERGGEGEGGGAERGMGDEDDGEYVELRLRKGLHKIGQTGADGVGGGRGGGGGGVYTRDKLEKEKISLEGETNVLN